MSNQKIFYEIKLPKRETEYAIRLHTVSNVLEIDSTQCMHSVQSNKRKKRCPAQATDQCEFCGLWTCAAHFVNGVQIWIEDSRIFNNQHGGYHASPCDNCRSLSKEDLLKLRALRMEINR